MTSLIRRRPMVAASARRVAVRATCASAVAILGWSAVATSASAAPTPHLEAPFVQAGFIGLRVGAQGTDVTSLQRALIAAGINVRGGADGVFGPATRQAVVDFQSSRGLPTTGEVDQVTSNALASAGSGGASASTSSSGYVGLRQGARGPAVTTVQKALESKGVFLAGGADGVYGPATTRAVKQFQRWNGLTQTGGITIRTAAALGLGGSGSGSEGGSSNPSGASTPPPSTSDNSYVGIRQGARGAQVKKIQQQLIAKGVSVAGGADGVYGPATTRAVKQFQRWSGLTQTGGITIRTAAALGLSGSGGGASTPTTTTSPYLGLKVGSRGSAVKDVQSALIAAGVSVRGGADGVFGNATKTALSSYQRSVGIAASGTVDQATIDKLGLGSSNGPVPFAGSGTPSATPPPTTSSNPYVGLKIGSRGDKVVELQRALQSTGLVVRGGADGVFGSATASALKLFQKVNGIPQTGVTTERGVKLLALGSGGGQAAANPSSGGGFTLERFPVQGHCFFGDTWHAPRGGGRLHVGTDVIANEGNLLYAVADGEITKLFWDQPGALAGNGVRLTQPNGTYFIYLHMSGFAPGVEVGTKVKAGDVIGFVGNTGSSATAHLHFEIHPGGGAAINPYPYMKAIDDCANTTPQYQSSFT